MTASSSNLSVQTVIEPGDRTSVGIVVSEYLSEWHGDGNRIVMCFYSVRRAFKFLNELTSRLAQANAVAHFHLNPGALDWQTINSLIPLFDAVVDLTDMRTAIGGPPRGAGSIADAEPSGDDKRRWRGILNGGGGCGQWDGHADYDSDRFTDHNADDCSYRGIWIDSHDQIGVKDYSDQGG